MLFLILKLLKKDPQFSGRRAKTGKGVDAAYRIVNVRSSSSEIVRSQVLGMSKTFVIGAGGTRHDDSFYVQTLHIACVLEGG